MMSDEALPFLNIYEVQTDDGPRHLVGFLDPVLAGSKGIDERAVIGEFTPRDDGEFDHTTFRLNAAFVEALVAYMNAETARSPDLVAQASSIREERLYLVDPRNTTESDDEPPVEDVLGSFYVDDLG